MSSPDALIEQLDGERVFFAVGHRLGGVERYLVSRAAGRFEVFAYVPSQLTEREAARLRGSGVHVRVSIEPGGMGLYKSFAYEIFKRRRSVLLAFDGNSAGCNLIQEAKNGRFKCRILVSRHSRMLSGKAASLQGYTELFEPGAESAAQIAALIAQDAQG